MQFGDFRRAVSVMGLLRRRIRVFLNCLRSGGAISKFVRLSNKLLGVINDVKDLPLNSLAEHGVPFTICTDNPARCHVSLSEELFSVAKAFAFSIDDIRALTKQSLKAAFIGDNQQDLLPHACRNNRISFLFFGVWDARAC